MAGLWDRIRDEACLKRVDVVKAALGYEVYLSKKSFDIPPPLVGVDEYQWKDRRWVIGSYYALTRLAGSLRADPVLRESVGKEGAVYGRRYTDVPESADEDAPVRFSKDKKRGDRAMLAGNLIEDYSSPYSPEMKELKKGRTGKNPSQVARLRDIFKPADEFYKYKTLEAHHIVEKSTFHTLGLSDGPEGKPSSLSDDNAPCVLVVAELHQQFFTPAVGKVRDRISGNLRDDKAEAKKRLDVIYRGGPSPTGEGKERGLYEDPQMHGLRDIADIIIDHVSKGRTD